MPHELPHESPHEGLPHEPGPAQARRCQDEFQTFYNDGEVAIIVWFRPDKPVGFRAVVRTDVNDKLNPDAPLSREEFLAKHPLHWSVLKFPDANPKTRALCRRHAAAYHAHAAEWATMSEVEKLRCLDPENTAVIVKEELPEGFRLTALPPPK